MNYLFIRRLCNSFGSGYDIHAEINGYPVPGNSFYGYSKRDSVRIYRERFGLKGKHLRKIVMDNDSNTNDIQDNLIIRNGCGGTRAAYGTTVLLRTTAALLDTIHKVLDGSITENTLINITPNNIHVSSGLIPMERCSCCGN